MGAYRLEMLGISRLNSIFAMPRPSKRLQLYSILPSGMTEHSQMNYSRHVSGLVTGLLTSEG
jgi:hypothetical protein